MPGVGGGLTVVGSSRHDFSLISSGLKNFRQTRSAGLCDPSASKLSGKNLLKVVYQPSAPRLRR